MLDRLPYVVGGARREMENAARGEGEDDDDDGDEARDGGRIRR